MYTVNQFKHVLNTLFEPLEAAAPVTISYTCTPPETEGGKPIYKVTGVNGFGSSRKYGEHLDFVRTGVEESLKDQIAKIAVADRYTFFTMARERCLHLMDAIHEEFLPPGVLKPGAAFQIIRVFTRPAFEPPGDISPGDETAVRLARLAHNWGREWHRNLESLRSILDFCKLFAMMAPVMLSKPCSPAASEKIALDTSVGNLAHMMRLLTEIGVIAMKSKEQLFRSIGDTFTTPRSDDMSEQLLKRKFYDPETKHVTEVNKALREMLRISEEFTSRA